MESQCALKGKPLLSPLSSLLFYLQSLSLLPLLGLKHVRIQMMSFQLILQCSLRLDCPCAGQKPEGFDELDEEPVIPVATNNEIFPWNNVRLPDNVQPMRYRIHIHPNLTTLVVKVVIILGIMR